MTPGGWACMASVYAIMGVFCTVAGLAIRADSRETECNVSELANCLRAERDEEAMEIVAVWATPVLWPLTLGFVIAYLAWRATSTAFRASVETASTINSALKERRSKRVARLEDRKKAAGGLSLTEGK